MFLLHNKIHNVFKILSLTIVATVFGIVTVFLINKNNFETSAISAEGDTVVITAGDEIRYGNRDGDGEAHYTRLYTATVNNRSYTAFCANPSKNNPSGNRKVDPLSAGVKSNVIKYLIYLYTTASSDQRSQQMMNSLYGWVGTNQNKIYAYVHATIGYIYAEDTKGLSSDEINRISNIATSLENSIRSNDLTWLIAKKYVVFGIKIGQQEDDEYIQNVVWIENNAQYGNLNIKKCDNDTMQCTAQGNASLSGIKFNVYNNSGSPIIYNNRSVATYNSSASDNSGAIVVTGTTNNNGQLSFNNLPVGKYLVEEAETNSSYALSAPSQTVTLTTSGATLTFYDDPNVGKITVYKNDSELSACDQLGSATFVGNTFQLINNSNNAIYHNGASIAAGGVVETKTLVGEACRVVFEGLPYGSYTIKETAASEGYLINTSTKNVTIPSDNSMEISVTYGNQVIRGDVKFRKMDKNNDEAMENVPFRITSKTTGESHIVVTDRNGVVNTSSNFLSHRYHTNGYDEESDPSKISFSGFGTWFGKSKSGTRTAEANDSLGALPYDTYEIVELSCWQNEFCYEVENEKKTFTISENSVVVDLGDWENNCAVFSISTVATDAEDGDKFIEAGEEVTIKDTIDYCAKIGTPFIMKSILIDKNTGRQLIIDNVLIEKSLIVTSLQACDQVEVDFNINTSELAGTQIVIYEYLYYDNKLIVSHEDINDSDQTVNIISLETFATDEEDGDKVLSVDKDVTINDWVEYCLVEGQTFKIKGTLMNKETKKPVSIDGKKIEQVIEITPEEACGNVEMKYDFNTTDFADAKFVIFEELYYNDELIISHEDFDNESESINVAPAEPETGYFTNGIHGVNENKNYIIAILGIGVAILYVSFRIISRRRFINK